MESQRARVDLSAHGGKKNSERRNSQEAVLVRNLKPAASNRKPVLRDMCIIKVQELKEDVESLVFVFVADFVCLFVV